MQLSENVILVLLELTIVEGNKVVCVHFGNEVFHGFHFFTLILRLLGNEFVGFCEEFFMLNIEVQIGLDKLLDRLEVIGFSKELFQLVFELLSFLVLLFELFNDFFFGMDGVLSDFFDELVTNLFNVFYALNLVHVEEGFPYPPA